VTRRPLSGTTNIKDLEFDTSQMYVSTEWIVSEQEGGEWSLNKFYSFFNFRCDAEVKVATLMIRAILV
jgi:hypothetical protein